MTFSVITDTDGKKLLNQTYSFTAKDIDFNDLPKDQQQAILDQQTKKPATKDFSSSYIGEAELYDNGLTQDQVGNIEQALYKYLSTNKITASTITFSKVGLPSSDPNDPLAPSVSTFVVSFNGKSYNAQISNSNISTSRIYLYDASGQLLYDSKDLNPQNQSSSGCRNVACQNN